MSITTALAARRDALREREAGFTLIELLVVVLIIGILAAIAIPVYLGVQNSAKDSAAKSDLVNDKTSIVGFTTTSNGTQPTTAQVTTANAKTNLGTYGWTITGTNAFVYSVNGTTSWCLLETSATGNKFYVTTNQGVGGGTATTTCPATATW